MFDPAAHRANSASLANKTVLITGATSGIGQATALAFARRGANVAIIGRDTERGRRAIAACEGAGARASFIEADVT
ncbi:MAG TPA: SDR family NAD(P)-dependent oxidoreductase, partial [Bradyrhizobium sp.]|nr:SDR family NAD(P)-dependent oxidoreductase [Bradyrhizobium sp.]